MTSDLSPKFFKLIKLYQNQEFQGQFRERRQVLSETTLSQEQPGNMLITALPAWAANLDSQVVNFLLSGFRAVYMYNKYIFFCRYRQSMASTEVLGMTSEFPNDS